MKKTFEIGTLYPASGGRIEYTGEWDGKEFVLKKERTPPKEGVKDARQDQERT